MLTLDSNTEFGALALRRIEEETLAWLTTIDRRGAPKSVPVGFIRDGDSLLIYSQLHQAKLHNIERHPKTSLHLQADPTRGDILTFSGTARIDPEALAATADSRYIAKYRDLLVNAELTQETFSSFYSVPIRSTPDWVYGY